VRWRWRWRWSSAHNSPLPVFHGFTKVIQALENKKFLEGFLWDS